ncbi:MAG: hypothetical protein J3K34DRAFT_229547 [Monoraphidium minutum]|nr:MAG: hypothetical protein J3K34DRAFT_229547 [Monoraphidium minutum]
MKPEGRPCVNGAPRRVACATHHSTTRCDAALRRAPRPCSAPPLAQPPARTAAPRAQLWRAALERPGDEFVVFACTAGEFPTPHEAAAAFDALIVGGSHYSAYEDHAWILQLKGLIPRYVEAGAKIIGCCFGCQVLAEALGGRVGPNPSGRFVLGVEAVSPAPRLAELPAFERASSLTAP